MMECLKKRMGNSAFINFFSLVTKYKINTIKSSSTKVSRFIDWLSISAVKVKESYFLPAFQFASPAHQLLHLVLKYPKAIKQNDVVSSIFDKLSKNINNSSQIHMEFDLEFCNCE